MTSKKAGSSWFHILRGGRKHRDHRSSRVARTTRRVAIEPLESRELLASWTALSHGVPNGGAINTMMLLTDGSVMAQPFGGSGGVNNVWYRLTPDSTGSYANGTWSTTSIASMSTMRLYFASNVLQNGNVFVQGGEYSGTAGTANWTNTGEIYNTSTNTWTPITPNFPLSQFGDDPSILLPNGNILAGYLSGAQTYIFNVTTNTWSQTGTKQNNDRSDEETWIKLPDDSILSYNIFGTATINGVTSNVAQRYIPSTGQWVDTGAVPVALASNTQGSELGPAVLLPNGKVIQIGANNDPTNGSGGGSDTAIFDPTGETTTGGGTWTQGPTIPGGYVADDSAGVLLPNGQFLFTADTGGFTKPTHVFDYDYVKNTITDITATAPSGLSSQLSSNPAFVDSMLMLPNGQALISTAGNTMYLYTGDAGVNTIASPTISGVTANGGNSYTLTGTTLTGSSQGASYGDDKEMDTNYPIVSVATQVGTTYYDRTTNWNKTGVGSVNGATSTNFSLPASISSPPVVSLSTLTPVEGQNLNNATVATFTDPNGTFTGQYSANITWGDGTQTVGTITGPVGGVYSVTGTHTYAEDGPETVSVSVVDKYASGNLSVSASGVSSASVPFTLSGSASNSISVTDASVAGTGSFTMNTTTGVSTGTVTLATFTDPGGAEVLGDYNTTVDWGDTTTSPATITGPVNGVFTVTGSHVYSAGGQYSVSVTLNHDNSTPTAVTDTANVATTVTGVSSSTANGTYGVGKSIAIQVAFSGAETVTGTPELALNSGGTATYSSGSGTSTLTFLYTVGAGDASPKLDYSNTGALTLNGGTITGGGGIATNLTLASPGSSGSLSANSNFGIDTVAPVVVSYNVLFGASGSYNLIGSNRFDLPWTITGIQVVFSKPITAADLNSLSGLTATNVSGLGTTTLTWTINSVSLGSFSTLLQGAGADGITDTAGNYLAAGAGFGQNFKVLLGDVNGDGIVNSADLSADNLARSQPYSIFFDINGDGVIDLNDVKAVRARLGTHL